MDRRTLIATAAVVFTGGCAGGGSNTDSGSPSDTDTDTDEIRAEADAVVVMTNEPAFDPRVVEIATGETVAWVNESSIAQSVTANGDEIPEDADYFASGGSGRESIASVLYPIRGVVRPDETFTHTFETPGVYEYYSIRSEHRGMAGRVVVE
jgi:plastocyanin